MDGGLDIHSGEEFTGVLFDSRSGSFRTVSAQTGKLSYLGARHPELAEHVRLLPDVHVPTQ